MHPFGAYLPADTCLKKQRVDCTTLRLTAWPLNIFNGVTSSRNAIAYDLRSFVRPRTSLQRPAGVVIGARTVPRAAATSLATRARADRTTLWHRHISDQGILS